MQSSAGAQPVSPAWHDEAAWTTADHVAEGFEEAVAWILESALVARIVGAATK
jgi:hypothetical protein